MWILVPKILFYCFLLPLENPGYATVKSSGTRKGGLGGQLLQITIKMFKQQQ